MQDQASIPRPMEVEAVEKPSASSAYGQGSGILGALSSNSLASKPAGSNMQRLGSKMVIPSAIDSSGLVDIASISRQPTRQTTPASGLQLAAIRPFTHPSPASTPNQNWGGQNSFCVGLWFIHCLFPDST